MDAETWIYFQILHKGVRAALWKLKRKFFFQILHKGVRKMKEMTPQKS